MKAQNKDRPLIGISATLLPIDAGPFIGRTRTAVVHDYIQAVVRAGGIPFVLPVIEIDERRIQLIENVDGLILSGGYDVSPQFYDEVPESGLEAVWPERDVHEIALVQAARRMRKPILGICRGQQLINVALGGTLVQDIPSSLSSALQHEQESNPEEACHQIEIVADSRLHQIFGVRRLFTNSYHHQAIKILAPGLAINALAGDGIVEGIEGTEDQFLIGVQWHPELMVTCPSNMKLFQAFIEAATFRRHS